MIKIKKQQKENFLREFQIRIYNIHSRRNTGTLVGGLTSLRLDTVLKFCRCVTWLLTFVCIFFAALKYSLSL